MRTAKPLLDRVLAHTDMRGRCWMWRGPVNSTGYGRIVTAKPRKEYVHRLVYEWTWGPIPDGMVVMHACDNPRCVNPAHLSIGTQADNVRDMDAKGRRVVVRGADKATHCRRGHLYDAENSYRTRAGRRQCRACHRILERERVERLRVMPNSERAA